MKLYKFLRDELIGKTLIETFIGNGNSTHKMRINEIQVNEDFSVLMYCKFIEYHRDRRKVTIEINDLYKLIENGVLKIVHETKLQDVRMLSPLDISRNGNKYFITIFELLPKSE